MGLVVCTSGGIYLWNIWNIFHCGWTTRNATRVASRVRALHIHTFISECYQYNLKLRDILIAFPLVDVIPWSFESVVVIWEQNIWQFVFGWSVIRIWIGFALISTILILCILFNNLCILFLLPLLRKRKRDVSCRLISVQHLDSIVLYCLCFVWNIVFC